MTPAIAPITPRNVPLHWQILRFTDAFTDRTGGQKKIKKGEYLPAGALPVVDQGQEPIGGYTDDPDARCSAPLPCLLFGDHTKIIKYFDSPFALGADGVKVLEPRSDIDARFAFHYISALPLPEDAGYSRHFKFLKRTWFPLPPLPEQQRIAAILDKADAVRRKRQQTLDLADNFLRSAFLDLFGDPVTNPKRWPIKKLGDVVEFASGGTPSKAHSEYWDGSIPWISPKDMKHEFLSEAQDHVTQSAIEETSLRLVPSDSLLIVVRGMILAHTVPTAINRVPTTINQDMKAMLLAESVLPIFLLHVLLAQHQHILSKVGTAAHGTRRLEMRDVAGLPVVVPDLNKQGQFVKLAEQVENACTHLSARADLAEHLAGSLTQRAFRGEL